MRKLFELSEKEEAESFGEAYPQEDDASVNTATGCISGMGIADDEVDDEANSKNLNELIDAVTTERSEEDRARERAERDAYEQAENERCRKIEEEYNRKRFEKEQAEKAARLAEEEERRREEEEEAREEFEQSLVGRLSKFFKKKPKAEKEEDIRTASSYTGEDEEALPTPEILHKVEEVEEEKPQAVVSPTVAQTVEPKVEEIKTEEVKEALPVTEEEVVPKMAVNAADLISKLSNESADAVVSELKEASSLPVTSKTEETSVEAPVVEEPKEADKEAAKVEVPTKEVAKKAQKVEKKEKAKGEKRTFKLPSFAKGIKKSEEVSSEPKDSEEIDWKYIATHDENTGLGNTRAFKIAKEKAGMACAILFFDVNNLKFVNDNFGHDDGDLLLKRSADAIAKQFGANNAFRTGGDEFVVILPNSNGKKAQEQIGLKVAEIHKEMQAYAKKSDRHVPHSISIGLAVGDGKHSVSDVLKAADAAMYRNKKAYKESHPEFNARLQKKEEAVEVKEKDHDELLSKEQRDLKSKIKSQHTQPSQVSTESIVREIQRRAGDVHAIFIASPNFDYLYIIRDVGEFVAMALEQSAAIDYSYLYVVWEGGPQYYGADTYYNEVTDLFKEIAEGLMSGKFRSEKDIRSIKGLNIFKCVYV